MLTVDLYLMVNAVQSQLQMRRKHLNLKDLKLVNSPSLSAFVSQSRFPEAYMLAVLDGHVLYGTK